MKYDTDQIMIMRDVFQPQQLLDLIECLSADDHRCAVFDDLSGIRGALCDPRSKMLLVGPPENDLSNLVEAIRTASAVPLRVPIVVYLKQCALGNNEELFVPEFDDFLLEPLNLHDVRLRVRRLERQFSINQDEVEHVKQSLVTHFGMRRFIGTAPSFMAAVEKIPRVAACDATVLLTGETGTGKEMCAHAIHYLSSRADGPMISVNCGSIPTDLFENELFGHESGAFTDARQPRRGLISEAEGGTLFLDEVDSLPVSAQVKLLRFLQDRQYKPLGASRFRKADVRLIAASNQDLQVKVRERALREDLYYRLKVISLSLPPLCERKEDIAPLAVHFLETAAQEYNRPVSRFSRDAMQRLSTHVWPGNVRELENVVRQAVVFAAGPVIHVNDIHLSSDASAGPVSSLRESLKKAKARVIEQFEREYLKEVLASCGGNISQAAREAQKDRRTFFALLKKYGLTQAARTF